MAADVKQIDWQSISGGIGAVESLRINNVELLPAPVYPSEAYPVANYPHCDDMFNIFPPYGNGIIGADGRKSIIHVITSDYLPVQITYSWYGPHEALPVCSMGGVSFAGYAEINVYIEAQDNSGKTMHDWLGMTWQCYGEVDDDMDDSSQWCFVL